MSVLFFRSDRLFQVQSKNLSLNANKHAVCICMSVIVYVKRGYTNGIMCLSQNAFHPRSYRIITTFAVYKPPYEACATDEYSCFDWFSFLIARFQPTAIEAR